MTLPARSDLSGTDTTDTTGTEDAAALLAQVRLIRFGADPPFLQPLAATTLTWEATVPPGVRLELDGQQVGSAGSRKLRPRQTHTYTLSAHAGPAHTVVGRATVTVDLSACKTAQFAFEDLFKKGVRSRIESDARLYFQMQYRTQPSPFGPPVSVPIGPRLPDLRVRRNEIELWLHLMRRVDTFPDATVEIHTAFSIANGGNERDNVLVPVFRVLDASISFPWYAWAVPGAVVGLAVAVSMAEKDGREMMRAAMEQFVSIALLAVPANQHVVSVEIVPDLGGTILLQHCPTSG